MTRALPWIFAVLAALLAALGARGASPTDDEPTYVGQGARILARGDFDADVLLWQPPLALYVTSAALPLVDLAPGALDAPDDRTSLTSLGDRLIWESPAAPADVLAASRAPVWIVCGFAAALAAWIATALAGVRAGAAAGILAALSPPMIAHGGLATTDAVATAAMLGAVAPFAVWLRRGDALTARRALGAGALLGLALASKHTAAAVVPVSLACAFAMSRRDGLRAAAARSAALLAAAAVVLWASYGFDVGLLVPPGSAEDLAAKSGKDAGLVSWIARHVPVPAPRWWQSLHFQASKQHGRLYFSYFDMAEKVGWWSWFPVVTAGKATLGSVALAGCAAWTLRARKLDAPERALLAAFAVPFAMAVASRHNLGVRHVLPALTPLGVFVAIRLARHEGRRIRIAAAALLALHAAEGLSSLGDPVAWWNAAYGGTRRGWLVARGSCADWGQGLWRLRRELAERGIAPGDTALVASGPASSMRHAESLGFAVYRDGTRASPLPDRRWIAVTTSLWRPKGTMPFTAAPETAFLAGCWRLYPLPLPEPRTE